MFGRKKAKQKPPPLGLCCSFCNKSQRQVRKMIAGPNVQICDECVDICVDITSRDERDEPFAAEEDLADSCGARPTTNAVLLCGLCRVATPAETSLHVAERGVLCAGCIGAIQAALAERAAH